MFKKSMFASACALALLASFGCSQEPKVEAVTLEMPEEASEMKVLETPEAVFDAERLLSAVQGRSDEDKVRDNARNPLQTLEFFKVAPGMSVAEALPGGGWYSKVLASYLGSEGHLHGINYNDDMWARFGFFSEDGIAAAIKRTSAFPGMVSEFNDKGPTSTGFTFNSAPEELAGTVDRVLFIRALHNLSRFETEAGTMTQALATTKMLLKDGGLVGVVQHQAPEVNDDKWADGSAGYLKKSAVIAAFNNAGFELLSESSIHENAKDVPTEDDIVWRLPPSYNGTADDPELKAAVDAIGESSRMTLLFIKAK